MILTIKLKEHENGKQIACKWVNGCPERTRGLHKDFVKCNFCNADMSGEITHEEARDYWDKKEKEILQYYKGETE